MMMMVMIMMMMMVMIMMMMMMVIKESKYKKKDKTGKLFFFFFFFFFKSARRDDELFICRISISYRAGFDSDSIVHLLPTKMFVSAVAFISLLLVNFLNADVVIDNKFSIGDDVIVTQCQKDVDRIIQGLRNNEIWAIKIVDASSKFPSGILKGHVTDFGNYDECFDVPTNETTVVPTQHCFVNFKQSDEQNSLLLLLPSIKLSYCLPKSCSPKQIENFIRKLLSETNLNVTVGDDDCTTIEKPSMETRDYVGISIWGIFICLALLSTAYDVFAKTRSKIPNPVLTSFSLYTNFNKLLSTETRPDTMTPLHGLRFLSICWVILGHRFYFTLFSSPINFNDFIKEVDEIYTQIIIQGVLSVDTFFLLSGLLNCYHLLKILDKTKKFSIVTYYLHRYLRLTPVLGAVVLMYTTWYVLIGSGPLWLQTTSQWKKLCVDYWWPTLLYINNYYNPTSQCAGQSWYLAVDMQLYWLSPLVILPLWKWPKLGKCFSWFLLTLSVVSVFAISYIYEFRASFHAGLGDFDEYIRSTKMIYVPTHTRATPYIIGILLGNYLYFLSKTNRSMILDKKWVITNWFASTLICLSILFGNYQFTRPVTDHPYNRLESSIYISLHRLGWGLSISWIILSCLNKYGGFVNSILSWKAFVPLSRLTYCIFLSHMAVQQYQIGSARTPDYFQYFNEFHRFFGDVLLSIIFATGLSLIFESPILVLEKLFLNKSNIKKGSKGIINKGFEGNPNEPKNSNFVL
ncbi:conserved hypothetical protein [Pediculus humanus corporis]|uniref:Nose resistant-to-fluoxetine protein N-terminal domain-containing protein n=1 Tax=Pediculus humanus subsp. corporis TaxID=121224 RepID=E0VWD2_PEDHC|nr:uncharacterized protein Phum_PHUM481880 [Pediculus humanus corporis]EEB17717.1 conserved hypothetical protein [Pediculus humanus corporis]